jgi:hypothetical protein
MLDAPFRTFVLLSSDMNGGELSLLQVRILLSVSGGTCGLGTLPSVSGFQLCLLRVQTLISPWLKLTQRKGGVFSSEGRWIRVIHWPGRNCLSYWKTSSWTMFLPQLPGISLRQVSIQQSLCISRCARPLTCLSPS